MIKQAPAFGVLFILFIQNNATAEGIVSFHVNTGRHQFPILGWFK
jgi:hypothetical protein